MAIFRSGTIRMICAFRPPVEAKLSVSLDQSFFFQRGQILTDRGKSHVQILYDLKFGSLPLAVDVLIDGMFVDLF